MSGDSKPNANGGGAGFRAKLDHYFYSGDKKHVVVGIALITAVFAVPWYFMSRGTKQMSHQDYMEKAEKADKARSQRLSSGSAK
ncbi:Multivesicular body subunit 12B like [Senna tora]|uniref:Multivesicular body subunit 12B like n=1 Tax=Senna tora TaxID=362788 RepID=A0A835CK95_9FABA|nr:Multivesicular body subunit 12B like [Senna tora]